jgi:hypothetical protein
MSAGNRLWRVETPAGPALQKRYGSRAGPLRDAWRGAMSRVIRGATATSPSARLRTERRTLALWAGEGIDVPADWTDRFPHLAGEGVVLLEWIDGEPLDRVVAAGGPGRAALLRRFAAAWGRRHGIAVARNDGRFAQFHAGLMHTLVAGGRLVSIDLEQAYLAGPPVFPRVGREAAAVAKSLSKSADDGAFAELAAGYPDPPLLRRALAPFLGASARIHGERKAGAVRLLDEALAARGG